MAKKKKTKTSKRHKSFPKIAAPFQDLKALSQDSRVQMMFGLIVLFIILYVFIASISFFFTGGADQSIVNEEASIRYTLKDDIQNWTGYTGAIISDWFINKMFGIASFLMLIFPVVYGFRLLSIKAATLWRSFLFPVLYMFLSSVLFTLLIGPFMQHSFLYIGGVNGALLTDWLRSNVGIIGTVLVLLVGFTGTSLFAHSKTLPYLEKLIHERLKLRKSTLEQTSSEDSGLDSMDEQGDHQDQNEVSNAPDSNPFSEVLEQNDSTDETLEDPLDDSISLTDEQWIKDQAARAESRLSHQGEDSQTSEEDLFSDDESYSDREENSASIVDDFADEDSDEDSDNDEDTNTDTITDNDNDEALDDTLGEASDDAKTSRDDTKGRGDSQAQEDQVPLGQSSEVDVEHYSDNETHVPVISKDGTVHVTSTTPSDGEMVRQNMEPYDPTLDLPNYKFPSLDFLKQYPNNNTSLTQEELEANRQNIVQTLANYGITIDKITETVGPTITLYEIVPAQGVRISRIRNLQEDIMMSLAAEGIRIIAPIPGKSAVGIEVPNQKKRIVSMYSVLASKVFQESKMNLPIALGRTITNEVLMFDLTKMPHILVAGATGQGKSVGLNAIITSLLYKKHPSQLKFVLIDPKKVEFSIYSEIERHYLAKISSEDNPVITDVNKVVATLNSICVEMDDRYDLLQSAHVRDVRQYNKKFTERRLNPEKGHRYLPYIVVIVDEFGDLIMTAGKEVEMPIARIAQLARAVGIHMILATQRPSVNIITGSIKANFPGRIAFKVSSAIDSKTILDGPGANQLIGQGDLLITKGNTLTRVQCAFIDTPEVERIVNFIADQRGYPDAFELPEVDSDDMEGGLKKTSSGDELDELFAVAARHVYTMGSCSTSNLQRNFKIGFNRAGRIVDQLCANQIVGKQNGSKAREVLVVSENDLKQRLEFLGV